MKYWKMVMMIIQVIKILEPVMDKIEDIFDSYKKDSK